MPSELPDCVFDDRKGVSRVGDLILKTDTLEYAADDRVIPLWPEEQGVTMSFARRYLHQNATLLDLGSGSGVFTLAAAQHGCRAIGIDHNRRAVDFARANAERNGIESLSDVRLLRAGAALFALGDITTELNRAIPSWDEVEPPDVVILNAPYHPTMPGLYPAQHAFAGADGQRAYVEFIRTAAATVVETGVIILHQMTTINANGHPTALSVAEEALARCGREGRAVWFSCMSEPAIGCATFLRALYAGLADENQLTRYIRAMERRISGFDLITAAIRVNTGEGLRARRLNAQLSHGRTWDDRVQIHRAITARALEAGGRQSF